MKKKRSTSSKIRDSAVLVVCLLGSFLSLLLFWRDLNRTFSKIGETPIATITYKYRVAQRKFIDRLVWDRLRQSGPIYNGDVIRTAERAEASLRFSDETEISIGENSIIQVYFNEEQGASTVFGGGSIQIDSSSSGQGMELISGSSSVTLDGGASVSASGAREDLPSEGVSGALSAAAKSSGLKTAKEGGALSGIRNFFSSLVGNEPSVSVSSGSSSGESPSKTSSLSVQVLGGNASFVSSDGQSVSLKEGSRISSSSDGIKEGRILVSSPRQNSKYFSKDNTYPVEFSWTSVDLQAGEHPVLEISMSKNFSGDLKSYNLENTNEGRIAVNLSGGTYYWRINIASDAAGYAAGSDDEISGRISVIPVRKIKTVSPDYSENFGYRTTIPSLRFAWTEDPSAVSYILEIADNESMYNSILKKKIQNASAVISSLTEGDYYWRVIPVYQEGLNVDDSINNFGEYTSGISSFKISRLAELPPPYLTLPLDGDFVDISSQITFAWANSQEADFYSLILAKDPSMTDSRKEIKSTNSFIRIDPEETGLTEGTWYWTVTQTDREGTESASPVPRPFAAVQGQVVFGSLFPENGYRISETLIYDTKFTWKNNIPGDLTLQIARDSLFSDIVVDKTYSGEMTGVSGLKLDTGYYYWRIISPRISETMAPLTTEPKMFYVQPRFPEPANIVPVNSDFLRVLIDTEIPFSWDRVTGAEYYQVRITSSTGQIVFEDTFAEEPLINLNSSSIDDGIYYWTIQAMATETPTSTRMVGRTASQNFRLVHVKPVNLVSPTDNAEIDGVDAILNPPSVEWSSQDPVVASHFILSRSKDTLPKYYAGNKTGNSIVVSTGNPGRIVQLPVLSPGTYWWTVVALTDDAIDISAPAPRSFRILPLPKLPAPDISRPVDGTVFDPDSMMMALASGGDSALASLFTFSWFPVKNAEEYELKIYTASKDGNSLILTETLEGNANTTFSLEDQSVLDEGDFIWTVEAKRYFVENVIQGGEVKENSFEIELPSIPDFTPENPGVLYGQ